MDGYYFPKWILLIISGCKFKCSSQGSLDADGSVAVTS